MALLGQVHELEVQGERPRDDDRPRRIDLGDLPFERAALIRLAGPRRDRAAPAALHESEQLDALLLGHHLPEECAEELDLVAQRIATAARAGKRRLGASCRVDPDPARRHRQAPRPAGDVCIVAA